MPTRIAIVGGGITGLAAAYHIERMADAEIDLYEASSALGGKLRTLRIGGFLVEEGPDSFFTRKPGVMELVCELGIEAELVQPLQKEFFMLVGGKLHRVPTGLVTLTYAAPQAIAEADFLSAEAKRRVLDEPNQPVGTELDESINSFFSRRYGPEFSRLVAEPLLAGTHGGGARRLSMKALYPSYFELERKHGSLAAGTSHALPNKPGAPSFLSFQHGMGSLVDALEAALNRTRVHLNQSVTSLDDLNANQVLICIPANAAAALFPDDVASLLRRIEHKSSAIVTFAFDEDDIEHVLDGTGFLVPEGESPDITGATWSSRKWPNRAPDGMVLMRVFMGGAESDADERLIARALAAITPILGINGKPHLAQLSRWIDAMPQYRVGHLDRIKELEKAVLAYPNVHFAGTSFGGVGIPDCLRQARSVAEKVAETASKPDNLHPLDQPF